MVRVHMLVPIEEMWLQKSNLPVLGGYKALVSQNHQFRLVSVKLEQVSKFQNWNQNQIWFYPELGSQFYSYYVELELKYMSLRNQCD
jgi:hypothetical protein